MVLSEGRLRVERVAGDENGIDAVLDGQCGQSLDSEKAGLEQGRGVVVLELQVDPPYCQSARCSNLSAITPSGVFSPSSLDSA